MTVFTALRGSTMAFSKTSTVGEESTTQICTYHMFNGTSGYHCHVGASQELIGEMFAWSNKTSINGRLNIRSFRISVLIAHRSRQEDRDICYCMLVSFSYQYYSLFSELELFAVLFYLPPSSCPLN